MGDAVVEEDQQSPLLRSSSEKLFERTGTIWTALGHIITGVIGAGVLSLAWSIAQLGWIAGPLCMIAFAAVTIFSSSLLCDCYRFPDPESGPTRNKSYAQAVGFYLGEKSQKVCAIFSYEILYGCGIAYTITTAASISAFDITGSVFEWLKLGWIAGPVALRCFAIITYVSASLLADCCRSPDSINGTPNRCYIDAVRVNLDSWLSKTHTWFCGLLQNLTFYGTFYYNFNKYEVLSSANATIIAIQRSNCYHREGHEAPCEYGDTVYMLFVGAVQIVMSQIPDFHNMVWLSVIAAIMSFSYSFIGLGLGIAKVIENGEIKGSISGVPASNIADKLWLAFQALGDIAFAYPYSVILLEIQDTLKSPPPENKTMKKASIIAILVTTFFYLCCGCFGYAAFGNLTPGNLLTGFGFYEPYWLIDFANACIVLHLVGAYQDKLIYSQPVFALAERWFTRKFPTSGFVNTFYTFKLPSLPPLKINPLSICFRTAYVVSTTGVAMVFPYFNLVLGVLGALNFWPLVIYFPVEMYFVQKKIGAWTKQWIVLRIFSFICLLVTIIGLVGSIEGLISAKLD
ncbi:hypothetical protein JRO89_XS03G0332900 [Xanthoceras sorbifolium]|uniref:Amino acid transporter transmembrane domain-containing protein n=1 Tax=Xanthoceras sorbifolium TaxID=99658 RepID=A0ABQ8IDY5_9ROSI|nr:hypothetical protein JRO89_XS03G0332900 [Xanthoceras sorbifolium]